MGKSSSTSSSSSRYNTCHYHHKSWTHRSFQRLGKNPEDYPDAKSQPHVQVALRMKARGGTPRSGDVIPYIFCFGDGGETAKNAQADRAKHPDEIRKVGSDLNIGESN